MNSTVYIVFTLSVRREIDSDICMTIIDNS